MTTHSIQTVWREQKFFDTEIDGHTITIDLGKEQGGDDAGPRPKNSCWFRLPDVRDSTWWRLYGRCVLS